MFHLQDFIYIEGMGDMAILEILLYYDGPQLFSCQHQDQKYLCMHVDDEGETEVWLMTPISDSHLNQILTGKQPLRHAFTNPDGDVLTKVYFGNKLIKGESIAPSDLTEDDLPSADSYLGEIG